MGRIVLVEDHPVVRIGMRKILDEFPYVDVIAECDTVHDAVVTCRRLSPELVVLPLRIGGEQHGIELCRRLRELSPPPKLLVYTSFSGEDDVTGAYLSGADSYLHKAASPARLGEAIRLTLAGHRVWEIVEQPDASEVATATSESLLTARETEILALMLQRRTNREIAEHLVVALPTVKTHVRNVLRKLGATSRRHLHEQLP